MDKVVNSSDSVVVVQLPAAAASLRFKAGDLLKRAFDIVTSFLGLLFLSPVFAYIAWRLHRDSPGPLLYRGRRMGRGGKVFDILKFRTMYEQPADHNGSPITARDDERITPFGRWLRDTKINELPQLWNVLIGQMSFVGPRPEDAEIASAWPEETKKCVLSVRPGITSPASVVYRDEEKLLDSDHVLDEYLRSILPDKLRLDVLYVHDRNFFSDLDVIFMTLIMLLPRIHNISVPEAALYSGPFYNFIRRYASWFVVDGLTALVAIVITGAFWRMGGPLNIGLDKAIGIAFAMSFMMSLSNTVLGLKKIVWKYASPTYVIDLGLSVMLSLLILWIIDEHVLPHALLPSEMILDFGFLTFFGFVISRYRERLITGLASRWVQLRGKTNVVDERVLVVGAGECGELAIWMMNKSHYATAFSVVGFVDDDFRKQDYTMKGYPILGTTRDIPELVKRRNIGLILFAISRCTHKERERILAICRSTPARLVIIPDFINLFKRSLEKQSVEEAA